jgi:hypothetical protein
MSKKKKKTPLHIKLKKGFRSFKAGEVISTEYSVMEGLVKDGGAEWCDPKKPKTATK